MKAECLDISVPQSEGDLRSGAVFVSSALGLEDESAGERL